MHNVFKSFVSDSGLEFYLIRGNLANLIAYIVKNPGLILSMESLGAGDIKYKHIMVCKMLDGCWQSCIEPNIYTYIPFMADVIITNLLSFTYIYYMQALSIPVHLMFTITYYRVVWKLFHTH
jgi:hypothetical protein